MIDLKQYGYIEREKPTQGTEPGRVITHQRDTYTLVTQHGEVIAKLTGNYLHRVKSCNAEYPCVGDFVLLQYNNAGDSRITGLLPRVSKFSRADFMGHSPGYAKAVKEQVVAANFDYVFILSSLNQDFRTSRILRYLLQIRQSGGTPVIVLTKADLTCDYTQTLVELNNVEPDVPVCVVSSHTGYGLDDLNGFLAPGKTVVFLGMSGVGKSSLLNALMRTHVMAVNAIREDDDKGRHTTTHRELFMLPSGAMVIDTPGMRELGLYDVSEAISTSYADIEALFDKCRFKNCGHNTEPDCAVREAIINGDLSQERWARYQAQTRENKFVDDRASYMRDKRDGEKSIALYSKSLKSKKRK